MKLTNKIYCITVAILSMMLTVSCTEDATIETSDSAYVPVIYGTITDQDIRQQVQLSSSSGYFDDEENKRLSDATVVLKEDSAEESHQYALYQDSVGSGIFKTQEPMAGKPGWTYKLTVVMDFNNDGISKTYQATSVMPQKVDLDSINITKMKEGEYTIYSLNISAQDPANTHNYYFCKYEINGVLYNKISKYIYFDDTSVNGLYVKDLEIGLFFDISDKNKFSDNTTSDMVFLSSDDNMTVHISNINKNYYDFINDCQNQKDGSNPIFGGLPANISTNISGGARGFFTTYAVSTASYKVPDDFTK